ncbi:hypothetical protein EYZ11_010093 [Aspergillus tanneri]|uniref:Uncharacterized protein n=1 Tax=Aspergillus tanneri TaxID=1220188 RepID=A0A4S3JBL6_9EURO|nr:hypothetical protein EYZ11_010093 [Aspergillus tanneri]
MASVPGLPPSSRLMFHANGGACAPAYAVNYNGVWKILNALSMTKISKPVDLAYDLKCKIGKKLGFHYIRSGDNTVHDTFSKA